MLILKIQFLLLNKSNRQRDLYQFFINLLKEAVVLMIIVIFTASSVAVVIEAPCLWMKRFWNQYRMFLLQATAIPCR